MYELVDRYCKLCDLCANRVRVINDVTDDAAMLTCRQGTYTVTLWGRVLATWGGCDADAAQVAFYRLDAAFDALWDARRVGAFARGV